MKVILSILLSTLSLLSLNADITLTSPHPRSVFKNDKTSIICWETHYSKGGINDVWIENGTMYIKLKHMTLFSLRPVLYYEIGWDEGDSNCAGMFKKTFKSVQDILALSGSSGWPPRDEPRHHFEFHKGQSVAIFLPRVPYHDKEERLKKYARWLPDDWSPRWVKSYNGREKQVQWSWIDTGTLSTTNIPLNYYDTSVNKEPLHVNLWEHPENKEFFKSSYPNSEISGFSSHSHLVEANLLEFTDIVQSIKGDTIDFLTSKIHARILIDEENLRNIVSWKPDDVINLVYIGDGIYEAWNRMIDGYPLTVHLSDSIYSDLRNFEISAEQEKK